jgi:hypothetical protein
VFFGTAAATNVKVVNSTTITATAPAGTGTVDVTVTAPGGTSASSGADQFTYLGPPTVSSVSPGLGRLAAGTAVTITGTNFTAPATVSFGTAAATNVVMASPTTITATAPAGTAGTVDVTVTSPNGTSATSGADQFTYLAAPTVTNVSPGSGPTAGATAVAITGTNFAGTPSVSFGATAATNVVLVNSTTITATAPAGTGTVNVTVTAPGGTSAVSSADKFAYLAPPTLTSVSPGLGPTVGGTTVTIAGSSFAAPATVRFGTAAATSVTVASSTTIKATAPAGTAGTVDVTVTTPGGTTAVSLADQFAYWAPPTVTAVSPGMGRLAAGTAVTITGTNFTAPATVSFGGAAATKVVVISTTTITATAPAGTAGTVDVTVTTPGGTSATSGADQFAYLAAPTVSSVSPATGPTGGGTAVTITGTNFAGNPSVVFGQTAATNVIVVNSTTITAVSPAGSGIVNVTVTTPGGTSATSTADRFTYH